jgi:oligosaccharide repeat unit polymerase
MAQAELAPPPAPVRTVARPTSYFSYPFFGILCVTLGTLVAQLFVPSGFHQPWAMFAPALCMTFALALPVVVATAKEFRSLLRTEHVMILGIIYWTLLDMLQGVNNPRGVRYESVTGGMLCLGLFAAGIWMGSAVRKVPLPGIVRKAGSVELNPRDVFTLILVCFSIGIAHYLISVGFDVEQLISYLGAPRFSAPWQVGRLGDWRTFQYHLTYFGHVVPTLTVILAHQIGWQRGRTAVGVVCSVIVFIFLSSTGSRLEVGSVLGAAIATWLLLQPRINRRLVITFFVTLVAAFLWIQLMLVMRNQGLARLFSGEDIRSDFAYLVVDDNFFRLTQVLDVMPETYPHTNGGQLFYVLVRPIPRVFWPGKPINSGFDFEAAIGAPGEYMSLSYTTMGEFYLDFGFPMVLVGGFLYGLLAAMWNRVLAEGRGPARPMLYGLGLLAMFAGIRSQQALMVKSFTVVSWLVVYKLFVHESSGGFRRRYNAS